MSRHRHFPGTAPSSAKVVDKTEAARQEYLASTKGALQSGGPPASLSANSHVSKDEQISQHDISSTTSGATRESKKRRAEEELPEKPKSKKAKKKKKKSGVPKDEAAKAPSTNVPAAAGKAKKARKLKKKSKSASTQSNMSQGSKPSLKYFGNTQLVPRQPKAWSSIGQAQEGNVATTASSVAGPNNHQEDQKVQSSVASDDRKERKKIKREKQKKKEAEEREAKEENSNDQEGSNCGSSKADARKARNNEKRKRRRRERSEREAAKPEAEKQSSKSTSSPEESSLAADKSSRPTSSSSQSHLLKELKASVKEMSSNASKTDHDAKVPPPPSVQLRAGDDAIVRTKPIAELELGDFRPKALDVHLRNISDKATCRQPKAAPVKRQDLFKPLGGGRITTIPERSDAANPLEQWKRSMRRRGDSDTDDSKSDSESESDSEDDEEIPKKRPVQGAIHESFAEQIFGNPRPSASSSKASKMSEDPSPGHHDVQEVSISKPRPKTRLINVTNHDAPERVMGGESGGPARIETPVLPLEVDGDIVDKALADPQTPPKAETSSEVRSREAVSREVLSMDELLRRRRRELGMDSYKSPVSSPPKVPTGPQKVATVNASAADDSDNDVYAAVDEATAEMMGEHIPMMDARKPKPPPPQSPVVESNEDRLVTNGNSDHATEDLPAPISGDAAGINSNAEGTTDSGEVIAIENHVHAEAEEDVVPSTGMQMPGQEQMGESGVLTSSPLSNELSELSKTPSLPEGYRHPNVLIPRHDSEQIASSSPQVIVPRQKMTGSSSKQFSSAKRSRRSQTSPVREEESADIEELGTIDDLQRAGIVFTPSKKSRGKPANPESLKKQKSHLKETSSLVNPRKDDPDSQPGAAPAADVDLDAEATNLPSEWTFSTPQKKSEKAPKTQKTPKTPKTAALPAKTPKSQGKSTGRVSSHFIDSRVDLYNTTASSRRVPAGTSVVPAPSTNCGKFGIIQEEYWEQPFWLLVAVALLNKTTGRAAVPVFKRIMARYASPEELAEARNEDVLSLIASLGFQNNRTKTLITMAKNWIEASPQAGRLYRKKDYPGKGDGKATDVAKIVDEDMPICKGAIEIGHIFGCGAYAFDSWRIFCRDVLRGVADDYNGLNAKTDDFESEWKRVVPGDKELRACLRWMWLKEGWVWNPLDGSKRRANEEEMERAVKGEMEINDEQERAFATRAAGFDSVSPQKRGDVETPSIKEKVIASLGNMELVEGDDVEKIDQKANVIVISDDEDDRDTSSDNILVSSQPAPAAPASIKAASETSSTRRHTPSRFVKTVQSIEVEDQPKTQRVTRSQRQGRSSTATSKSTSNGSLSKTPAAVAKKRKREILEDEEEDVIEVTPKRRRSERPPKAAHV